MAIPALIGGGVASSPGWIGVGLMMATAAVGAPVSNVLVRQHDGTRLHGGACVAAAVVLLAAAALIVADAPMFLAERGRRGAAVLWFVAPVLVVLGVRLAWWGARLLVRPRPGWVRDRRRQRPHRLPPGAPDGDGGWLLGSPAPRGGAWRVPASAVVSTAMVGPPRRGLAMMRVDLAADPAELDAPAFVRGLWVDRHALEFPVRVDGAVGDR